MASYYENRILEVLEKSRDGLTTIGIAEKANISKTTTLKYLASLRAAGMIDYIEVGPAKLWRVTSRRELSAGGLPENKEKRVRSVLREFKEIAGLLGSVVVDNDGLTISADLPWNRKKPEKLGSLISRLLQLGERSAEAVKIDPLRGMILEGDNGRIIVHNEGNVVLIAISGKESSLGLIKIEIEEFARKIKKLIK